MSPPHAASNLFQMLAAALVLTCWATIARIMVPAPRGRSRGSGTPWLASASATGG